MFRFFTTVLFIISVNSFAQKVSGIVTDENQNPLPAVLVINMATEEKVTTNLNGEFFINASINNELRFVRKGFERNSKIVVQLDFSVMFKVPLIKLAQEIEEVEITYQTTGNFKDDIKNFGDVKSVKKLKSETAKYIRSESTEEVLAPKPGEFVQPVGQGFFIGGPDSQWDDVDFMQFLIENLGNDFFTQDLQLKPSEIQPFIYYIFRNFERRNILFKGICTQADFARFITESHHKLEAYRQNLPNNPPIKKKKK